MKPRKDVMENRKLIGYILRKRRRELDISQNAMARTLGRKPMHILNIERGMVSLPVKRLQEFCQAYQLPDDFLWAMLWKLYPARFETIIWASTAPVMGLTPGREEEIRKIAQAAYTELAKKYQNGEVGDGGD